MVSGTKLIPSELKRKNSKSPAVQDETKTSCSSVLSRRTPTAGKRASSLGTELRRGYVSAMKSEHKNRKKSLEEKTKSQKLNNSKLIVPEETSSVTGLKSSHTLLLDKVSDSVARCS
jgi:Tfp pilus tip-associated adhesin PilY1